MADAASTDPQAHFTEGEHTVFRRAPGYVASEILLHVLTGTLLGAAIAGACTLHGMFDGLLCGCVAGLSWLLNSSWFAILEGRGRIEVRDSCLTYARFGTPSPRDWANVVGVNLLHMGDGRLVQIVLRFRTGRHLAIGGFERMDELKDEIMKHMDSSCEVQSAATRVHPRVKRTLAVVFGVVVGSFLGFMIADAMHG